MAKKILSVLMVTVCLCTCLCFTAYAEENDLYISDEIVPAYEIAQNPSSVLTISGTNATCESSAKGDDCVSITVTHTLQKYSGWFWIYVSCGGTTSQYVVVDPYHSTAFPSKLSDFFATYSATKKIGTFND